MPDTPRQLVIFTRYPRPGEVKTRLIPELGPEGAAGLQRRLTERIVATARQLPAGRYIFFDGASRQTMQHWLGSGNRYRRQTSGNLGRRMRRAFEQVFDRRPDQVVLVGSDIPDITADILRQAFARLKSRDIVIGPAADGGYYLIGLRRESFQRACRAVFEGIPWGSAGVLEATLAAAHANALSTALLPELRDIDRPRDLEACKEVLPAARRANRPAVSLSVIIPALNEARQIGAALDSVGRPAGVETIVVDGGSRDTTAAVAASRGAAVIACSPGRGRQMNAGAAAAGGRILLFLHADTRLPPGYAGHVRRALAAGQVAAGAFSLKIDAQRPSLRLVEMAANFRSRVLKMPYGDQGFFVEKHLFRRVGGFADMPIMEDFELVRRLGRMGAILTLPQPALTSARRWSQLGVLRTWLINQAVVCAYLGGLDPRRIAGWYDTRRPR